MEKGWRSLGGSFPKSGVKKIANFLLGNRCPQDMKIPPCSPLKSPVGGIEWVWSLDVAMGVLFSSSRSRDLRLTIFGYAFFS
jgi:hypothetical protein